MFGWRKKKDVDGKECPLCQLVNAEESEQCTRCYYEFTIAAHRQTVSEVSDEQQGDIFDALMEEEDEVDDESPLVDWTSHKFTMDDMTVEVSQYDDAGVVEVDKSISLESQFEAPEPLARVKGEAEKEEAEDYILTSADAPKNVEKFDTGSGPDLSFEEEQYEAPVVKLVEMTESEDVEPVRSASTIEGLDDAGDEEESEPQVDAKPKAEIPSVPTTAQPSVPAATQTSPPAIPSIPELPQPTASISEDPPLPSPQAATTPQIPILDAPNGAVEPEPTPSSPAPIPSVPESRLWPWPQGDAWDDSQIRKALKESMEAAKAGNMDSAKRSLLSLGPHLGDRIDLIFHIGVLLKRFGQEDAMVRMVKFGQEKYPESPEVAKAVEHLLPKE